VYVGNIETRTEIVDLTSTSNIGSAISTPSSVPSLPSPIKMDGVQNGEPEDHHQSVDQLTLEIEVQDLIDRVTILEEGQEHMLKVQRSILKNQEQILSRLAALEKRDQASFGTPT
jgi:TolA-binding protein